MGSIVARMMDDPSFFPVSPRLRLVEDRFAHDFVAAKRAAGVGWSGIARMLGRCELDLRRLYDPDFDASQAPGVVSVAPKEQAPTWQPRQHRNLGPVQVAAIKALGRRALSTGEVAAAIGKRTNCANVMNTLRERGLAAKSHERGDWALTDAGRRALEALRG